MLRQVYIAIEPNCRDNANGYSDSKILETPKAVVFIQSVLSPIEIAGIALTQGYF
ncbi:hypothetical protein CJA_2393 [Cellvibrio japonicus Ueda107]|uniref:Uncharacterized protein n=1 Tax=Cellvibrio japonicus (strain Ueda107) TaxID=498211 RepID=B3PKC4_CELJU|nr:hypothetical protein CJA_2393 [Cellvibrio japonicus Ueda107]